MPFLDRDPLIVLSDAARACRTRADQLARCYGMTRAQWMILVWLERQPGMSQNELATIMEVEPITVGRLVDRLEKRDFVERRPDAADRRIWRLHLTPAAAPMLEEISKAREAINAAMLGGIPEKDVQTTIDCLLQMKTNIINAEARAEKVS